LLPSPIIFKKCPEKTDENYYIDSLEKLGKQLARAYTALL